MGEFRRASNEFKMQMEEELRISEQTERQKQIAAMEAAAPVPPPLEEPEHPHLPRAVEEASEPPSMIRSTESDTSLPPHERVQEPYAAASSLETATETPTPSYEDTHETIDGVRPVPIATSGSLHMMPPDTGLPTPRSRGGNGALTSLVDAIPEAPTPTAEIAPETAAHGD
jgi:sec-independent protein translocase protein TatB